MIADVFHFSFTVEDVDISTQWYVDVLGLEVVHRQVQDNAYTRVLVGMDDVMLKIAQLRLPGISPLRSTHMLELVEYVRPKGAGIRSLPTNDVGCAHLALMVTDIDERYGEMLYKGVKFRNPPVQITEGANAGGKSCYFSDPNGITLELLQPGPDRLRELGLDGQRH